MSATGTTPQGTSDERQAAKWVQQMFAEVAPKYDLLNHLLSFNIDQGWRRHLRKQLQSVLDRADATVLDLCCGTGDVLVALQKGAKASVIGADFCHPMLVAARQKVDRQQLLSPLFEGDALQLPLGDDSLDAVSVAFGFRNLSNYADGLRELRRILKPGGRLAILEFSHPSGFLTRTSYSFYSNVFLPAIGSLVSGSHSAYAYLPDSIRKFPKATDLLNMINQEGFTDGEFDLLTGGIAALHLATK